MRKLAIAVIAVLLSLAVWGMRTCSVGGPGLDANAPLVAEPTPAAAAVAGQPADAAAIAPASEREAVADEGPLARFAVHAVDAFGDGVPDARIELRAQPGGSVLAEYRSDRDGMFDGPRALEGIWVTAHHPNVGRSACCRVADEDARLVLPLLRPVAVTVRVLGRDLRPMAGAAVALSESWWNADSGPRPQRNWAEYADDQGLLVVEAVYGGELTAAVDEARGRSEAKVVARESAELLLVALGAFRVEGSVVDGLGRPVPAHASLSNPAEVGYQPGSSNSVPRLGDAEEAPPSADFAFDLPGTGPGLVSAKAPGFECLAAAFEVSLARPRAHVNIVAYPLRSTRGTVVGASGRPCPGARVIATAMDGRSANGLSPWLDAGSNWKFADDAGAFEILLPTRCRWRLAAAKDAMRVAPEIECAAGEEGIVLHADAVVLPEEKRVPGVHDWRVSETSTGSSAHPLGRARLIVECADGSAPGFPWQLWQAVGPEGFRRSNVDSNWSRSEGSAPIRKLLCVMDAASGQSGWCWEQDATPPRTIRLQPPVELEVRVATEQGPARGVVVVLDPCGVEQVQRVNGDGVAPFPKAPLGPAFLRVMRGREALLVHSFEISAKGPGQLVLRLP